MKACFRLPAMMIIQLPWFCGCMTPVEPQDVATASFRAGNTRVRRSVVTWKALRERHVVMQALDYSCGSAALATLMRHYFADEVNEIDVLKDILDSLSDEEILNRQAEGLSMLDLKQCAQRMGYQAMGVQLKASMLPELRGPVLVHLSTNDYEHFAVLRGVERGRVYLADPSRGNVRMDVPHFLARWTRVALVLGKEGFGLPDEHPLVVEGVETVNDARLGPVRARYTLQALMQPTP